MINTINIIFLDFCFNLKKMVQIQIQVMPVKVMLMVEKLPFIPVRLFKEFDLKSINDDKIAKILTSSGTSGSKVSKIFLDKLLRTKNIPIFGLL